MFTSTWAGVFAADPEQPDTDLPAAGQENQIVDENGAEPSPAEPTKGVENDTENDQVVEINLTVNAIQNKDGKVKVTWNTIEGASFVVEESVDGGEATPVAEEPVASDSGYTLTLTREAGDYKFTVTATVGEDSKSVSADVSVVEPPVAIEQSSIRALSGCYSVQLKWKYAGEADGFIVYRYKSASDFNNNVNGKRIDPNGSSYLTEPDNKGEYTWTNGVDVVVTQNYWYKVVAVKKTGSTFANAVESNPAVIQDKGCVRPMYITLKLKKKRKLKSLNGGPKITLKKNTVITATGFGGGCYYFTYNGKKYRMARSSAKKQVALYNGRYGYNYSPEEAALFVNQAGLSSRTNYLIWTSFYTQHMYLMQWDKGVKAWKCIDHWDCATGKASTPSPTGDKAIGKKKKQHHNIKWWSSFSNPKSIANSIHGKKKGWKLGLPQSHGCIRNEVANAYKVYTMCPKYTKVYNY